MDDLENELRRRLTGRTPPVPATLDRTVLAAAATAAARTRGRRRLRLVRHAAAAAALVAFAAWLGVLALGTRAPDAAATPFDVADAWRCARGLAATERRFDLDGSGAVDARDADLMLTRIVALPRRGS
ncbi:MAG: hypothetical protein AB7O97_24070 [Planctomycetota bacterium]